jgi:para-aminobenzoate synthetase/4-amino-4-deoxychorismate lyase
VSRVLTQAVSGAVVPQRVRLLVNRDGEPRAERSALEPRPGVLRLGLAAGPIDPTNPFLFHKTTNRGHLERARLAGFEETALWNPGKEMTEGIISNLVAEIDGRRVTPPVACGLLPGTMRAELLARGEIIEDRITVTQFLRAPKVWAINSVRGWQDATIEK